MGGDFHIWLNSSEIASPCHWSIDTPHQIRFLLLRFHVNIKTLSVFEVLWHTKSKTKNTVQYTSQPYYKNGSTYSFQNPLRLIEDRESWDEKKQICFRYNLFTTWRLLHHAMWRRVFWLISTGVSEEPGASLFWENNPIGTTVSDKKSGRRETTKEVLSKMVTCGSEQGVGDYIPEIQQKKVFTFTILMVADRTLNHFVNTMLIYHCPQYLHPDTLSDGEIIICVYVMIPSSILVRWHRHMTA